MKEWTYFFGPNEMKEERVEGDVIRRIYTGAQLQVVEYRFPPNKVFPPHSHKAHEQMGYLVSGRMGFKTGEQTTELTAGEWYHAPVGVVHNAWTLDEPAVLIDIFSPPRDELR